MSATERDGRPRLVPPRKGCGIAGEQGIAVRGLKQCTKVLRGMERNEPVPLVPLALVPSAEGGRLPTLYIPCCVSHALRMFRKTSGARPVGGWPGAGLEGAGAGVGFASGACAVLQGAGSPRPRKSRRGRENSRGGAPAGLGGRPPPAIGVGRAGRPGASWVHPGAWRAGVWFRREKGAESLGSKESPFAA